MKEMKYKVDWQTMAEYEEIEAQDLEEAQSIVDGLIGYTQQSVYIMDEDGNRLSGRCWYGAEYVPCLWDFYNPIVFGDFGFYGDWVLLDY